MVLSRLGCGRLEFVRLGFAALIGWNGLGSARLKLDSVGSARLSWFWLGWIGLGWDGLGWGWAQLGWVQLKLAPLVWARLGKFGPTWARLD